MRTWIDKNIPLLFVNHECVKRRKSRKLSQNKEKNDAKFLLKRKTLLQFQQIDEYDKYIVAIIATVDLMTQATKYLFY